MFCLLSMPAWAVYFCCHRSRVHAMFGTGFPKRPYLVGSKSKLIKSLKE